MSGQEDLLAYPCTGKYLSVTATFAAESREQVEAICRELKSHELFVMTL